MSLAVPLGAPWGTRCRPVQCGETVVSRKPLISEARLALIETRQEPPGWGKHYQPSMRATRDEAPTISRPSTVYSPKIGRELHFMSVPERKVCLLALYHPRVFDVHEQHMLNPFEAAHPLAGREDTRGMTLMPFKGTVNVAERFGRLSQHPRVWASSKPAADGTLKQERSAFPYIGDLLLFLHDDQGPYCVNWTVKKNREGFTKQHESSLLSPKRARRKLENAQWRLKLEKEYFADAGIKTHQIAADDDLDWQVTANLTALIGTRTSPLTLLAAMTTDFGCTRSDCLGVLHRGIWERQLRVDLHQPILVDKPLHPERSDVLLDYAHYFQR